VPGMLQHGRRQRARPRINGKPGDGAETQSFAGIGWSSFFYKDFAPKDGRKDVIKVEQSMSDGEDEGGSGGETIYGGKSLYGICEIEDDMRTTIWILRAMEGSGYRGCHGS
jgi:hypothetical protein